MEAQTREVATRPGPERDVVQLQVLQKLEENHQLTVEDVSEQVQTIQRVLKEVMKEGEHYGKIPGCGNKLVLMKSGGEKLGSLFRLAPKYDIKEKELGGGHIKFRVTCSLVHISTGSFVGEGVGSCSTMESKYRYRKAKRVCPACGKETIIKGKREYGGGWICWKSKGGCGAKFDDKAPEIVGQKTGKVENPNIADEENTVLKMAKKRAHVDAILTATAASDIFTQDLEDKTDQPAADDSQPASNQNNGNGDDVFAMKKRLSKYITSVADGKDVTPPETLKIMTHGKHESLREMPEGDTKLLFNRYKKKIENHERSAA